ncbi:MAG: CPBP family intramembrane metalloprotease [Clostridia bacterium]|nr:CPBP family intramembrane metalloprotease [Clostridia bacterium]
MLYGNFYAIKKSLRKSGFNEPLQMLGIMMLFILGVVMFPTRRIVEWFYKGGNDFVFVLADGLERILFSALMIRFALQFGFRIIPRKTRIIDVLVVLPAFVIAVNNFPFVSFFSGDCSVTESAVNAFIFAVWCVGVGLFEELSFRGVILPLVLIALRKIDDGKKRWQFLKKRQVFFTLALSSAIFALTHLVNIFNGNIGGTFLQVGYTFLIGAMCGIITVKTGNVLLSATAHIVYNFCGMLIEKCGDGVTWTLPQIIFTAAVGTVLGVYLIAVAVRSDKDPAAALYMLGEDAEPEAE